MGKEDGAADDDAENDDVCASFDDMWVRLPGDKLTLRGGSAADKSDVSALFDSTKAVYVRTPEKCSSS